MNNRKEICRLKGYKFIKRNAKVDKKVMGADFLKCTRKMIVPERGRREDGMSIEQLLKKLRD